MSKNIQKADFSKVVQEKIPYTVYMNKVIQNIPDAFALGVWCYLSTLPENWVTNKEHLCKHFQVGRDKIKSTLKYLSDNYLIEYVRSRDDRGVFNGFNLLVKNGTEYVEKVVNNQQCSSTVLKTQPLDNPAAGESAPTKEIVNTKKKESTNMEHTTSPTIKKRSSISTTFQPTEAHQQQASELGVDIAQERDKFVDYYLATGKVMKDWCSAFRNWIRKAAEYKASAKPRTKTFAETFDEIVKECTPSNKEMFEVLPF